MSSSAGQSSSPEVPSAAGELTTDSPSTPPSSPQPSTTPPPPPLAAELGQQQQEVEWAKESKVTTTTPITITTTTTQPTSATDSGGRLSAGGGTTHQLKCSVTLDKLPKRVRLALTKNSKTHNKKKAALSTTNGGASAPAYDEELVDEAAAVDDPSSSAVLCQFCDRSLPDQQHYDLHQEQEHLTANLGRRASGRASSINSFPGCSLCNVVAAADNKHFTCHSNDLDALFAHLIEKHADRYFACRSCNERYADADTLARHTKRVHRQRKDRKKSSSVQGELNKVGAAPDPSGEGGGGEKEIIGRKVTRQSNHYHNRDGASGGSSKDEQQSPSLSRMAQAQNRFSLRGPARAIKGRLAANSQKANETRNGRGAKLSRSTSVSSTSSNQTNHTSSTGTPPPSGGLSGTSSKSTSNLPSNNAFDENFYETITVTVRRNLSKWVDGKIEDKGESATKDEEAEEDEGPSADHLLDHPPPTVRSTLFRTPPVGVQGESEIHEATALSAVTAFPTLLTAEQYGLEGQAGGKIKRMFTKNSWKWKFDFVKKYKYVNEGGKIVKKAKEQNLGQRDLSKLDMWTQLTMRTKHEETKRRPPTEESDSELDTSTGSSAMSAIGESVREEKRRQVNQLETILDSRLLPQIGMEQNEQRLIKLEAGVDVEAVVEDVVDAGAEETSTLDQLPKKEKEHEVRADDFPLGLQLKRNPNPIHHKTGLTLSGEWARPRCYVCIGCGSKFETVKLLQDHKLTEHPNTQTTHYEMVGRELIEGDLFQHLYIPQKAIRTGNEYQKTSDALASSTEKPQRGRRAATNTSAIVKIADDATVPCSKCKKDCAGRFELYRHMLDCVGDYAWLMAKKRFKYRYYGNRSRRRKSNARSVFGCVRPQKKTVKKERLERIKRRKMRSRRTKSQKPSDAETIEKMLANLPEKRVSRTVTTPPSSATKVQAGGVSTATPLSSSSASASVVTPAKTTAMPVAVSSLAGKKVQQQQQYSTSKASTTAAAASIHSSSPSAVNTAAAAGTKRNLRSTLEAAAATAIGESGPAGVKGNKKSKSTAADKREVKVAARETVPEKSEPEDRKEDEIVAGKEADGEPDNDESTNGKVEQGQRKKKKKAKEELVDAVVGKRKTFMTRLASNTKGIIKKIGRQMKGKNAKTKKQQADNAGHSEAPEKTTTTSPVEGDSFLDEASRGLSPAAAEEDGEGVKVTAAVTTTKLAAILSPTNHKEGDKSASEESASVAADSQQEPDDKSQLPNVASIVVPVSIVVVDGPSEATPSSSGEQQEKTGHHHGEEKNTTDYNNKGTLSVPELSSPQVSPSLSVPSNASNLSSPMTSPTMQKRRIRKLNDCIARLTDKLQEKLTKPTTNTTTAATKTIQSVSPPPPLSSPEALQEPCISSVPAARNIIRVPQLLPPPPSAAPIRTAAPPPHLVIPVCDETPVPLDVPLNLSLKRDSADSLSSSSLLRLAPVPVSSLAAAPQLVDECGVVDLRVREMFKNMPPSSSSSQQSPPFLALNPEKNALESNPQSRMRLPDELMKMPMNLANMEQQPQNIFNANGELIVPHVPKLGNYEVIKIPTYLPQKPVKGSRRSSKAAAAAAGTATVTPLNSSGVATVSVTKKSNATSAIEKITELFADVVRNKKREAARKELAEAAAVHIPPLPPPPMMMLPSIPVPVIAVSAVMPIPPLPLLIPPPIAFAIEVPQKKKNSGRKRGGKSRSIGSIFEPPAAVFSPDEQVQGKTVEVISEPPPQQSTEKPILPIVPPEVTVKVPEIVRDESVIDEVPVPVVLRPKVDIVVSADSVLLAQEKEQQNDKVNKRDNSPAPTVVAAEEVKLTEKKPTKAKGGAAKGKKKVVIVEPEGELLAPLIDGSREAVELHVPTTPTRSKRNVPAAKKPKGVLKKPSSEQPPKVIDDVVAPPSGQEIISPSIKGQNGKVQRTTVVVNKSGKENKKVKIVEPEGTQETEVEIVVKPTEELFHAEVNSSKDERESNNEGQELEKPATPKVRKKRQSELAQILATQPVINNTERDMSLTRRKSICIPELSAKRIDSPKLKPSPPKRKKDNVDVVPPTEESPKTVKVTEQLATAEGDDNCKEPFEVDVEEKITANIVEAVSTVEVDVAFVDKKAKKKTSPPPKTAKGPRVNKKKGKKEVVAEEETKVEEEIPPVESDNPVRVKEVVPEELSKNPTPKPKKKRRSELTQIIADQLLESFKEVDEAQKDNLKILHDLSWADETMEIASRLKQSPIPRRQVTKKKPHLAAADESSRKSPVVVAKKPTATEAFAQKKAPEELAKEERGDENKTTAEIETAEDTTARASEETPVRPQELNLVSTNIESEKTEALPIVANEKDDVLSSPINSTTTTTTTSLFNTPVTAAAPTLAIITPKPVIVAKHQQQPPTTPSEEMSLFWKQNVVDKEAAAIVAGERRLDWVSKASEMSVGGNRTVSDLSDDSSTNKQPSISKPGTASSTTTTFVLKPSRLQAIASPPLVDSFDLLRNCDRSSASSSFCSPVVSPVGEPKKSLLSVTLPTFNAPVRSTALPPNGGTPLSSPNAPLNLLQFRDVPREVDESDGDLEDNVSVHSSDSMESSMTTMTKSKVPRKRRKRSLLTKKKVRAASQLALKANKENGQGTKTAVAEKFHCEICNKTFEKADRLAKHKITLTHISRLSEIEFLNSQNAKAAAAAVALNEEVVRQAEEEKSNIAVAAVPEVKVSLLPASIPASIPALLLPPRSPEPQNVAVGTGAAVTPTPLLVSNLHRSPLSPGVQAHQHSSQSTLHNVHLEPISSPEQPQPSYLMSGGGGGGMSSAGIGGTRPEAPFGAAMSNVAKRPSINVAGLSQEEKLFYECCNMLKGSDRVGTQSENNSLTPRSNEAVSTWYSKTSTAFAVRSPTSNNYHRQRSPKYAFSKLDLNQFSDISSDSDNTYPSRGRPLVNGAQQVMAPSFQNVIPGNRGDVLSMDHQMVLGNLSAGGAVVSPLRRDDATVAVYSDSDMGDSFPSAPGASDNESYVRTILDRSSNNNNNGNYSGRSEWVPKNGAGEVGHEGAGYRREEATATTMTNDQSAAGKVKTKAAMKGFDNFRVSIPTDGLDMDQALNGGAGTAVMHPHLDSKLASLADIALRSSTLPLIETTAINVLHEEEIQLEKDLDPSAEPEPEEEEDHLLKEDIPAPVKTPTKKGTKNGRKAPQTRTDKNSVGNRLGFKAKKRKGSEGNQAGASKSSSGEGGSKNGLDVYDFDDSQGSTDALILPMKKSGKSAAAESTMENRTESSGTTSEVAPASRVKGRGKAANKKTKAVAEDTEEEVPEESLSVDPDAVSSDSFSDRDDFNYNSPAVEDSDLSSRGTPVKIPSTPPAKSVAGSKKAAKKPLDNVQKKCLIMGRIFKNAQKNSKPETTKASSPPLSSSAVVVVGGGVEEGGPKKAPPKVELDKLFDILKGDEPKVQLKSDKKGGKTDRSEATSKKASSPATIKNGPKNVEVQKSILKKTEKRGKAPPPSVHDDDDDDDDEEDKQTKKLIAELINDDLAVGQRKSKRKCIQQVNFVETWSSDEYEEFHSTKDIIAMIEANEKKSGGGGAVVPLGRKKKVPSATVEEPIKMPEKRVTAGPGKIQSRRKTIGFKETDDDIVRARKEVRFSPIREFVAPTPKEVLPQKKHKKDVPSVGKERGAGGGGGGDGAKQVGRQKRVSSEKLYYWSSSSSADDEDGESGNAAKGSNGKVKMGSGADDDEDNDSAMEQHGWIVGGSHKKLVTMLAHAKGKKSDVTPKK